MEILSRRNFQYLLCSLQPSKSFILFVETNRNYDGKKEHVMKTRVEA